MPAWVDALWRMTQQCVTEAEHADAPSPLGSAVKLHYSELTQEIAALEEEKQSINEALNTESDYQKLLQLGNRLQEINQLLDEKELRWLELDEWS